MRIILGILIALLVGFVPLHAQGIDEEVNEIMTKMRMALDLNESQVTDATRIVEKYTMALHDLQKSIDDNTINKSAIDSQKQQLKEAENQGLSNILKPDQMSRWRYLEDQASASNHDDNDEAAPQK